MAKSSRRREARIKTLANVGLVVLAVATAGVVASVAFTSRAETPVSAKVQQAYDAGRTLAPEPDRAASKTVAFLGDSYSAGAGATNQNGWVKILAEKNNWRLVNYARGGTGYLKAIQSGGVNACGTETCPNYLQMADKAIEAKPDVVIISGGRNDGANLTPDLGSNVSELFTKLRAGLPNAKIIATNPIWAAESPQPDATAFTEAVTAGVSGVGGSFVSIGAPLSGHPEMITKDNVHPNDAGHQHLAKVIGEALAAAKLP